MAHKGTPRTEHEASDELTWNQYLDDVIRHLSAAEKQQVYAAVGVSRTSFQRWRNGDNLPDAAHIPPLLKQLAPEARIRLTALMVKDPKMRVLLPDEIVHPHVPSLADGIASTFYALAFRVQRETTTRFWTVTGLILGHLLSELEQAAQPVGMSALVARCMPAQADGRVRSLRCQVAMGTAPWRSDLHREDGFFGAEALVGEAVRMQHITMQSDLPTPLTSPTSRGQERSAAACPILVHDGIAGALLVVCQQPDFFSHERLTRIEQYADLLRLACFEADFAPKSQIALTLMPPLQVQQRVIATSQQRVEQRYRRSRTPNGGVQDLSLIEQQVWQEIEAELIHLAAQDPFETSVDERPFSV